VSDTDESFDMTWRKVLGGIITVGAADALADTGTDGFEELNGEDRVSAPETALANDRSENSVDIVVNV
jgi:hypothetical protein